MILQKVADVEVERFMEGLVHRNPGQPLFHQAVREVSMDVMPYIIEHPEYRKAQILERLTEPDRVVSFRVCWLDDAGNVQTNRGYRVQFSNAIGPYKGGLRFHPSVRLGMMKFLAFEQVFKNSLTTLPMGGAKGGADFDPKGKSDEEIMKFCQSFMTALWKYIGKDVDVPAGDIGVGGREIGYLFGQYKRLSGEFSGTLTGKGHTFGGSFVRTEATGYGCVYFVSEMLKTKGDGLKGKTCLVSGAGNVAQYTVEKLNQLGAKPITLSDSNGFIHDPDGIDPEKLAWVIDLKTNKRGRIAEYAKKFGCPYYPGKKPWGVNADLAFPSATQNEINERDARTLVDNGILAVAEGSNMATTPEAVHIFQNAGVLFAPGKAANAGGVAVSGLEQTQNAQRMYWTREEVDSHLHEIMKSIHAQCVEYGSEGGRINYVKGANLAGFVKVAGAVLSLGVV